MNKMCVGIVITVICMAVLMGCSSMKFDQITNKDDLLTEKYSITQIEELKNTVGIEEITFSKFKKEFEIECIRKTHQGYYVVLLMENGEYAFVFFDEENIVTRVLVSNGFKSKIDFQSHITEQMKESEVLKFDPNAILTPVSAKEITAHIVQEGVFIVEYSRFADGKMLEDPIVSSLKFIENDDVATSEDLLLKNEIPFVLEIDKMSK